MKPKFVAWRLGWRAFTARGPRATSKFLLSSSLAMALGLVPLVVVLSVADGMIDSISSRTIETALYHVQAWSVGLPEDRATLGPRLTKTLAAVPGFRGAWPEQQGFALAYAPNGVRLGLTVRGIDPRWAQDPGVSRYLKASAGSLTMDDALSVWIGREAAQKLHLVPGDTLKLLTTKAKGNLQVPRVTTVRIAAVISVGYQELDRLWLFAPLELTTSIFDPQDQPIFWGIQASGPLDRTPAFLADVRQALGTGWQAVSWQTTGRSQFLNYQATRALLAVVMALVLLVAAFNVSTSMVTTVGERRKETAILKALGASDTLIRRQFVVLGFGAGLVGTAVGLGAGMAVALSLNGLVGGVDALVSVFTTGGTFHLLDSAFYLESLPVKFDPVALGSASAGSVVLAVLASWWPARRASKDRPLEVLRRA
jgi:lipoprotein-releasing system permease protein